MTRTAEIIVNITVDVGVLCERPCVALAYFLYALARLQQRHAQNENEQKPPTPTWNCCTN